MLRVSQRLDSETWPKRMSLSMARVGNPPALSQTHVGVPRHRGRGGEAANYCCRYSLNQNQVPSQLPLTWKDWTLATIGQLRTKLRYWEITQECFSLGGYFSKATMPLIEQPIEVNPWGKNKWRQSRWALQVHVNGTIHQVSHLSPTPKVYTRSVFHMVATTLLKQIKMCGPTFPWSFCTVKFLKAVVVPKGNGC